MNALTATQTLVLAPLAGIGSALASAIVFLGDNSRGARAAREAERLYAMSDAELAEIGLHRDQILYRAFGPMIYI